MSWYWKPSSSTLEWKYRAAITIDNSAGGAVTRDITMTIPADWDLFWDNVQADGDDIRVCSWDGRTLTTYQLQSWSQANRTGTIEVDDIALPAASMVLLWVYWGNTTAATAAGSFVIGTSVTGYIDVAAPTAVVMAYPQAVGQTTPRDIVTKPVADVTDLWIDPTGILEGRGAVYGSKSLYEEPYALTLNVLDTNAGNQTGLYTLADCRFVGDKPYLKLRIKAGTNATPYTVVPLVISSIARTLDIRVGLRVQNVLLTS